MRGYKTRDGRRDGGRGKAEVGRSHDMKERDQECLNHMSEEVMFMCCFSLFLCRISVSDSYSVFQIYTCESTHSDFLTSSLQGLNVCRGHVHQNYDFNYDKTMKRF